MKYKELEDALTRFFERDCDSPSPKTFEELKDETIILSSVIPLLVENKRFRKTLEWYAKAERYQSQDRSQSDIFIDGGQRANESLNE